MMEKKQIAKHKLVAIILDEPENPDNIGAVARAMKNMGASDLRLVLPPDDWKTKGKKMAVSAADLLESAKMFPNFKAAVKDLSFVIATTRRERRFNSNWIPFAHSIEKLLKADGKKKVGIVFGKESKGLSNQTISECDWVTTIPAHPDYPSINLAQAVMITVFSIYARISEKKQVHRKKQVSQVSKQEIREVLDRIRISLRHLGYDQKRSDIPGRIIATFHGFFKRVGLVQSEANMLKGLTRRIIDKNPLSS